MLWLFVGVVMTVAAGAVFVTWPALAPRRTRWEALLIVQTQAGVQFAHRLAFKAATRSEARAKALRLAARRFEGCGIQLEELNPC